MNYTYLHYQIGLTLLNGIGPSRAKTLLDYFGSPENIFETSDDKLHDISRLKKSIFKSMDREGALKKAVSVADHMEKNNIKSVFYTDANYPRRLKQCVDGPLLMYYSGEIDFNASKVVSIVGTRNPTSYGFRMVQRLIESFKDHNIVVVSGLAKGIDGFAHHLCVENNIPTWGVLGHGLDRIYPPEHKTLAGKMISQGGLITEFIPNTDPESGNFPMRNRIVAGLSDATIVIESKKKGGSLITARLANDYSKDVFAIPGNIDSETSKGCNLLIEQNLAHILTNPEELIRTMGWGVNQKSSAEIQPQIFVDLSPRQKTIVDIIGLNPGLHIDALSLRTSLPITTLNVELFELEMSGVVRPLPGKTFTL